jgi:hypothetical protein
MKTGIKLVVSDTGPSRLLQPTSEARLRLAALINRRLTIESKLRHLGEATAKLQEAADAEGNARAAFNALDSEETQAMAAWSKSSGPKPVIDRTRREKLKADLEDAAASATAARNAASSIAAEQQREALALKALEAPFAVAVAEVLDEEMMPLLADFEAEKRTLAVQAARIQEGVEALTQLAHQVGAEKGRPAFVVLEKMNARVQTAFGRLMPDNTTGSVAKWLGLAARLRSDPLAKFED